jgi:hypothetical protein
MLEESNSITMLVDEAVKDRSKLKRLISLLYDSDMKQRFVAAKALGEIARSDPEFIKQRWRHGFMRMIW